MSAITDPRRLRIAIGVLLLGSAVFVWSMYGYLFGGSQQLDEAEGAFVTLEEEEGAVSSSNAYSNGNSEARILEDLLAKHGSFDRQIEVRAPFKWILPPAPVGEVAKEPDNKIRKNAARDKTEVKRPPALTLSMVMRAKQIRRAVVDGAVVGIGDHVAAGIIMRIRNDGIEVDTGPRVLFYKITQPDSREESTHGPRLPAPDLIEANKREGDK